MHSFFLAFMFIVASIFTFHSPSFAAIGEQGASLQFQYEIIELNEKTFWLIQHGDQLLQIKDSEMTHETLVEYKELIEQTQGILQTITFYSIYILLVIACAIWFIFTKPQRLKHPLFLVSSISACFFAYIISTNYTVLQEAEDNLRYFYLLLENIG